MASLAPLSKANTAFSQALLKKLGDGDNTANVFFSPFSISSALAMVLLGARGNTAVQMSETKCLINLLINYLSHVKVTTWKTDQCLKTKDVQDDIHASFGELLSELNKHGSPYALTVANRLYGEKSYQFIEEFLTMTRKHYDAELEAVNFRSEYEAARININNWVEKRTREKIKDLLVPGLLDPSTKLVLVNAIYLKVDWDKKFEGQYTKDADFRINKNDKKKVKMMHQKSWFPFTYIPEVSCQVLELPCVGKELSMLIFLPNEMEDSTTGLEKLEKELTYENFVEWTRPDMMDSVEVMVGLPRFKMEEKYDLKGVLVSLGMADAFDPSRCDFSGMSPEHNLFLSAVVHKAFINVNEIGIEAAAAATVVVEVNSAPMRPPAFIADHPFLFFIRHNHSNSILFAGRYCSPE